MSAIPTVSAPAAPLAIRWARVFAALFLGLMLLEVGGRLLIWRWSGRPYRSLAPYRWSAYGLVRNNPDLNSPAFQINRNGFRDFKDYQPTKRPGTLRVLLMGGSTLYSGLGRWIIPGIQRVDSGHTISQYMEKELRADPALAGVEIEVINAGVNFNRVVEISSAYLTEYVHWRPDFVIVCGSANNFGYAPAAGTVHQHQFGIQQPHPWHLEFQRMVNDRSVLANVERSYRGIEEHCAVMALGRKATDKLVNAGFRVREQLTRRLRLTPPGPPAPPLADLAEADLYINEYLGYADAMVSVARRHGQQVSFFWEHFIAHLDGIKPFTPMERLLYQHNRPSTAEEDARFEHHARGRVRDYCATQQVPFLDPLEALRHSDETVFIDYLHYTKEGNRFMARFMHEQLKPALHRRAQELRVPRP